ncbi:MAG TPA: IS3 family transposase [Bacteroidia bacterium]|nr:IS3 family transposase [Bacteroidia bacterium]
MTTKVNPKAKAAPNLLQQDFTAEQPNQRWVADITYMQQVITHRNPDTSLIHHSDKGSQYASNNFQLLLKKHSMIASMSGIGNCYDNAAMESFFHTLKTEHIYFKTYHTREQAKQSIFDYVEIFYNRKRRHSTLGYLSPSAFEKQWYQQQGVRLRAV